MGRLRPIAFPSAEKDIEFMGGATEAIVTVPGPGVDGLLGSWNGAGESSGIGGGLRIWGGESTADVCT